MSQNEMFRNARHHFGYFPVSARVPCVYMNGEEEPFINPLHLVSDEIIKSEVDVMVRCKKTGVLLGQLGKVSELRVGVNQPWFKIDSTEAESRVVDYFRERSGSYSQRPYFVSEHVSMLNPDFKIVISKDEDGTGLIDVVSYIEIEV